MWSSISYFEEWKQDWKRCVYTWVDSMVVYEIQTIGGTIAGELEIECVCVGWWHMLRSQAALWHNPVSLLKAPDCAHGGLKGLKWLGVCVCV